MAVADGATSTQQAQRVCALQHVVPAHKKSPRAVSFLNRHPSILPSQRHADAKRFLKDTTLTPSHPSSCAPFFRTPLLLLALRSPLRLLASSLAHPASSYPFAHILPAA
eukprot:365900-Chlamydomonas_euryale.AAC.9